MRRSTLARPCVAAIGFSALLSCAPEQTPRRDDTRAAFGRFEHFRRGLTRAVPRSGRITLPARADGELRLRDALSIVATDLRGAPVSTVDGVATATDVAPGVDVAWTLEPARVEELRLIHFPSEYVRAHYSVQLPAGNTLVREDAHLLVRDAAGRAVARSEPVVAIDADGRRFEGTLRLEGDRIVAEAHVHGARFPLLLDPGWVLLGTGPRVTRHTALSLDDGRVLVAGGKDAALGLVASCWLFDPASNTWSTTGALSSPRADHSAIRLADGRIVVAGGTGPSVLGTTEVFDPKKGAWSAAGPLVPRYGFALVRGPGGKPLAIGGATEHATLGVSTPTKWTSSVAELDPSTLTWTERAPLPLAASAQGAVALSDGRVAVFGGVAAAGAEVKTLAEVQVFDGTTWTAAAPMKAPRMGHAAALLASNRVLVAGGAVSKGPAEAPSSIGLSTADEWDPSLDEWRTVTAALPLAPSGTQLAEVVDREVFILSDRPALLPSTASLYDPWTRALRAVPTPLTSGPHTATTLVNGVLLVGPEGAERHTYTPPIAHATSPMSEPRAEHTATRIGGAVLLVGGVGASGPLSTSEEFDLEGRATGVLRVLSTARVGHTATALGSRVVVAGGRTKGAALGSAEVYDAATRTWSALPAMSEPREGHVAVALDDHRLLVAGGANGSPSSSAELFDLTTGAWTKTAPMALPRAQAGAALLGARAFVVGGRNGAGVESSVESYDVTTDKWTSEPALVVPRVSPFVTTIDDTLFVAGDSSLISGPAATPAESFRLGGVWNGIKILTGSDGRHGSAGAVLGHRVVLVGGPLFSPSAALDAVTDLFVLPLEQPLTLAREGHAVVALDGRRALVSGGRVAGTPTASAELLTPGVCISAADCASGARCLFGRCRTDRGLGDACSNSSGCDSGFCVDGVCCNQACLGTCESCAEPGLEGTCSQRLGAPAGARLCGECTSGACGASSRSACAPTELGACNVNGRCVGADIARGGTCRAGACELSKAEACPNGFACITPSLSLSFGACPTACADDSQCRHGFRCVESRCQVTTSECEDTEWEKPVDGPRRRCSPFACVDHACATSCRSLTDCSRGFECTAAGTCEVRPPAAGEDAGCAASRGQGRLDPLLGLVALGLLRRRRAQRLRTLARHACEWVIDRNNARN